MSQEMHVLRPARFFTGDFKRAVQRLDLGKKAVVIGAVAMPPEQAEDIEEKLKKLVIKHTRESWSYGQDSLGFSTQLGYAEWHHTRAFAAYEDHPFRKFLIFGRHPFDKGFHPQQHPALITSMETRKTSFPNLVFSHDNKGFFFPVTLAFPVETQFGFLGSTLGLKHEVARLQKLMLSRSYRHDDLDRILERVHQACESSIALHLPIIIDG
jgi:hypothetical protein